MQAGRGSRTALSTALMRAAHTRGIGPVLVEDAWADRLILAKERQDMLERLGGTDLDEALRAHPAYGVVILRACYTEQSLAQAVARGVSQYVIVGAGMDSLALRRPAFAHELEIFEVDHPDTQAFKAERLRACGLALPAGVHLVAADLAEVGLDAALAGSPHRRDRLSFFAWLGVTIYLTRAANLATLSAIANCAPAGSELVFDYADQGALQAGIAGTPMSRVRTQVAAAGEPWVSGFYPGALSDDLRNAGLELIEDLGPEDLQVRYCSGRTDELLPSPGARIAHARVAA